jgi:hypothetical protein
LAELACLLFASIAASGWMPSTRRGWQLDDAEASVPDLNAVMMLRVGPYEPVD